MTLEADAPTGARRGAKSAGPELRRVMFAVHGFIGMKLSLLVVLILATGTLATVSREIDWLLDPAMRAGPGETRVGWQTVAEAIRTGHPDADLRWIEAPEASYFAFEGVVVMPNGQNRRVYVDPHAGTLRGDTSYFNVQRFLRSLHMNLFTPAVGLYLVSLLGAFLLASLVSGLVVYRKFWRGFFRLRTGKGRRVLFGDLHKLAGVWSIWFVAVIAITSIWYFVEMAMYDAGVPLYRPAPTLSAAELEALGDTPPRIDLDRAVATAEAALPGLDVRQISLPGTADELIGIEGQDGTVLVRDRANKVFVNPYTGVVEHVQRADELDPVHRWVDTADPLHFGDFGGLASKLVWFAFGLVLTGIAATGAWLYIRRVTGAPGRRTEGSPPPVVLGRWGYLSVAVLLLPVWFGILEIVRYYPPERAPIAGPDRIGPWRVQLSEVRLGRETRFAVEIDSASGAPVGGVRLEILSAGRSRWIDLPGGPRHFFATLPHHADQSALGIEITDIAGAVHDDRLDARRLDAGALPVQGGVPQE